MKAKNILGVIFLVFFLAGSLYAAIPQKMGYEGRLTDSSGKELTGAYNMRFSITSDLAGSSVLWGPETHSAVNASAGIFSVMLGDTLPIPTSVFSGSTTYVKIEIANPADSSNFEALSPLRQLLCAGYTFRAAVVDEVSDGSITTAKLADASVTDAKIVTVSGSKVIGTVLPGAHASSHYAGSSDALAVSTNMIDNNAITTAKLATNSVTADAIADGAVTALKLANTAVVANTYGDGTHVGKYTVDAQGRLTSAENVIITGAAPSGTAGGHLAGTYPDPMIATGVVTSGAIANNTIAAVNMATNSVTADAIADGAVTALKLANTAVVANTYGDGTHVGKYTVDAQGRLTSAESVAITGGGGSPAGSSTEVQFNNGGAFGSDSTLTFDSNKVLGTRSLNIPTSTGTNVGTLQQGGAAIFHTYGTDNIFAGANAGNLTLTGKGKNSAVGVNALVSNVDGAYNSALGYQALYNNTTGAENSAVGAQALQFNTTGNSNSAVGTYVLNSNITGNSNTALGDQAGYSSIGSGNLFLGYQAGYNETGDNKLYIANSSGTPLIGGDFKAGTVTFNGLYTFPATAGSNGQTFVTDGSGILSWAAGGGGGSPAGSSTEVQFNNGGAFGADAALTFNSDKVLGINSLNIPPTDGTSINMGTLQQGGVAILHTYGNDNVFAGANAGNLTTLTGKGRNSAVGVKALTSNIGGAYNSALGYYALYSNTEGNENSAVGPYVLYNNTTGSQNSAVGSFALNANTTGYYNSALGSYALNSNTEGGQNSALGYAALTSNTTGTLNSAFGYQAGYSSIGSGNVFLGYQAGYDETGSNKLYIANSSGTPLIGGDFKAGTVTFGGLYTFPSDVPASAGLTLISDGNNPATLSWGAGGGGGSPAGSSTEVQFNNGGAFGADAALTFNSDKVLGINSLNIPPTDGTSINMGTLQQGGVAILHTYGNDNVFAGANAGNLTTLTGKGRNSAVGVKALTSNIGGAYNSALGYYALYSNTEGNENSAVGPYVLYNNTTGSQNSAVGSFALVANTTGSKNSALGYQAGYKSSGDSAANVFLGYQAGYYEGGSNKLYIANSDTRTLIYGDFDLGTIRFNDAYTFPVSDGSNGQTLVTNGLGTLSWAAGGGATPAGADTQVQFNNSGAFSAESTFTFDWSGTKALTVNSLNIPSTAGTDVGTLQQGGAAILHTFGTNNIFAGASAGNLTLTGTANSAVGASALISNTTGSNNSAVGYQALTSNTEGGANSALGYLALYSNTLGNQNSALGKGALYFNTTGNQNSAVGVNALNSNTEGNYNSALGAGALFSNTTGNYNSVFGYYAGGKNGGSGNVFLGYRAGETEGGDNKLYIANSNTSSPLIGGDFSTGKVKFNGVYEFPAVDGTNGQALVTDGGGILSWAAGGGGGSPAGSSTEVQFNNGGAFGSDSTFTLDSNKVLGTRSLNIPATTGTNVGTLQQGGAAILHTYGTDNIFAGANAGNLTLTGVENSAVGVRALSTNTTGFDNSAVGVNALYRNTTGGGNSAVGAAALYSNTTGNYNSAVGYQALNSNETGVENSAVGESALYRNTSGYSNSAVGRAALYSNTTGNYNSALGQAALYSNTVGEQNSAVGLSALSSNTEGSQNSAVGSGALASNTEGYNNSAVGVTALNSNTTGTYNSALGYEALKANTTGYQNSAVGTQALYSNTTGAENSAVGIAALNSNITGSRNSAFGYLAGYSSIGSGNVFLGYQAGLNETGSNKLYIANSDTASPLIGGDFSTGKVKFNGAYEFPSADATSSGQALVSNASGVVSWATVGGGTVHVIGDSYGGGIVFYVTSDNLHGLIAETQDSSTASAWYLAQDNISDPNNHSTEGKKYADWRLPTKYELNLMYVLRATIGSFASSYYWGSTEFDNTSAWRQDFSDGTPADHDKASTYYVRAVRGF